jgi:hypothetical protein
VVADANPAVFPAVAGQWERSEIVRFGTHGSPP